MREMEVLRDITLMLTHWSKSTITIRKGEIVKEASIHDMGLVDAKAFSKWRSKEMKENGKEVAFFYYLGRPRGAIVGEGVRRLH